MEKALDGLPRISDPNLIFGTGLGDDAGVYVLSPELAIVQTVDFFTPIVDDPYDFGCIAAANALSDCYCLGATPTTALNIVTFPCKIGLDVLREILRGGADTIAEAGACILGGHSIQDDEPKYGIAVTGVVHPDQIIRNDTAQPGDALVLNKALGTGIISNLSKKKDAVSNDPVYQQVVASMKQLHKNALPLLREFEVHAATDITGFGFLGHAQSVAAASGSGFTIWSDAVPVFEGVRERAAEGGGGAVARNSAHIDAMIDFDEFVDDNDRSLLHDAQTSGPLLLSLPESKASDFVQALKDAGFEHAAVIGEVQNEAAGRVRVQKAKS